MKEEFQVALLRAKISYDDLAKVDVAVRIDGVVATKADADRVVLNQHIRDDRVAQIGERALPAVILNPAGLAVDPDAETEARAGVILQADVRVVDVGEPVLRIERDDERAVANDQIA